MPLSTLRITEIFHSIQGESTWVGRPCVFVRLAGCHLRCHYCDTEYAFKDGTSRPIEEILGEVEGHGCPLVQITGGEPLLQPRVHTLIAALCDRDYTVLIETSGACDIARCDPRAIVIMDLKTPGSGESERNCWANIQHLKQRDEVKFVIADRADYEWARAVLAEHELDRKCHAILFSAVAAQPAGLEIAGSPALPAADLAAWILADRLDVRLQVQMHKVIWDPQLRGV